ncbi:MAG: glycogen debranching enzyme N-terminal domain-containing protein [Sedimentisphaerales bacterium]|nr:glycogen debranching enzyme N-terminal domain-containing protein [Sedimentisphaerales bacterium]
MIQYSVLKVKVRVECPDMARSGFNVVLRTNLNQAGPIRKQFIDLVEKGRSTSTDYYDIIARHDTTDNSYYCDILLSEVGFFQFKVRVESADKQNPWVVWADGPNIGVSVSPISYAKDNSIYCAFLRNFGVDKDQPSLKNEVFEKLIEEIESTGAHVIGSGGSFELFKKELPFIIGKLGMKIIHFLPINPVPHSYGRMGYYGSPYATTDYFGIDHVYGTFSRYKTIEDQFIDLTSTIHGMGARVFLDMVINHTGWASSLLFTHRKWFKTAQDQKLISPGAWGVVWGDLVELDYNYKDLWQYMANVFLAWCERGVDGFRLDAGYMIPVEVWQYIISKVREKFPDTMFLLEGLGGPLETTEKLLTEGMNNWAYSELFQNYDKGQIQWYMDYANRTSGQKGVLVNYAETHDNDRLAKKGKIYTLMRLSLCAFTAPAGAWGFSNGVEWLATEKIDVHRNTGLNWGAEENLVEEISQINKILRENPAFWCSGNLNMFEVGNPGVLAFSRYDDRTGNSVVCFINLDTEHQQWINWHLLECHLGKDSCFKNLLQENDIISAAGEHGMTLGPGECKVYRKESTQDPYHLQVPAIYDLDELKIKLIYKILLHKFRPEEVGRIPQEKLLRAVTDLRRFIALVETSSLRYLESCDIAEALARITQEQIDEYSAVWNFRKCNKVFMINGDKWLIAETFMPCTAYLRLTESQDFQSQECVDSSDNGHSSVIIQESIPANKFHHWVLFEPMPNNQYARLSFNWVIEHDRMIQRQRPGEEYPVLSVPGSSKSIVSPRLFPLEIDKEHLRHNYTNVNLANIHGSVCQVPAMPGTLNTKYDTLLSVLIDKSSPDQRYSLSRCLFETVQIGQKVFDLDKGFVSSFISHPNPTWEFVYDDGEYNLVIERSLIISRNENTVMLRYKVKQANSLVIVSVKAAIEFRNIHDQFVFDPEGHAQEWLSHSYALCDSQPGYYFRPTSDVVLNVVSKQGEFVHLPHKVCGIIFPQDGENDLPSTGDAFFPGVFKVKLNKGESYIVTLSTEPLEKANNTSAYSIEQNNTRHVKELINKVPVHAAQRDPKVKLLVDSLDQFLIKAGGRWLLAAGRPWLGSRTRDSLHAVGGLIAAGRAEVARDIILKAAATEQGGLLANWLNSGIQDHSCLENSLRLFLAARSYVKYTGDETFWDCGLDGRRSVREVLGNIFREFTSPASPQRVGIDSETGMLYSPDCFTWMDTKFPQATKRAGYPVEIESLWYRALDVIKLFDPGQASYAAELRASLNRWFMDLFWDDTNRCLADVVGAHGDNCGALLSGGRMVDNAVRFNQLAAVKAKLVPQDKSKLIVERINRKLLIPGAIRSLSEDVLDVPHCITDDNGNLLVDPRLPYQGYYKGSELQRRLAAHNGTAWPFVYPSFIEIRAAAYNYSKLAVRQALAYFEPIWYEMSQGAIGFIPEMKDGHFPHRPRGCYAYALSSAEAIRVYMRLKYGFNVEESYSIDVESRGKDKAAVTSRR